MTRAPAVPLSTAPLPTKAGATVGSAPVPHQPAQPMTSRLAPAFRLSSAFLEFVGREGVAFSGKGERDRPGVAPTVAITTEMRGPVVGLQAGSVAAASLDMAAPSPMTDTSATPAASAPARPVPQNTSINAQPATGSGRPVSPNVSAKNSSRAPVLSGFSMTRAPVVSLSTAPLPTKAGATVGSAPVPHQPAQFMSPSLVPPFRLSSAFLEFLEGVAFSGKGERDRSGVAPTVATTTEVRGPVVGPQAGSVAATSLDMAAPSPMTEPPAASATPAPAPAAPQNTSINAQPATGSGRPMSPNANNSSRTPVLSGFFMTRALAVPSSTALLPTKAGATVESAPVPHQPVQPMTPCLTPASRLSSASEECVGQEDVTFSGKGDRDRLGVAPAVSTTTKMRGPVGGLKTGLVAAGSLDMAAPSPIAEPPAASAASTPARAASPTSIKAKPARGSSRPVFPDVSTNNSSRAPILPGFSVTQVPPVPPSTAPLPPKAGATVGSAPASHQPAPGPAPGPTPATAPAPAAPVALSKASESTTPSLQTSGVKEAEPCAETRHTLRRWAFQRQTRKASLAARSTKRQDPRVIRSRSKTSPSSAAKDSRRQTKRENAQEKREDEVLSTPAVPRVRGSHRSAYTRRVERKAFRKGALRMSCISALRDKEVGQGKGRKRRQGRKGLCVYTWLPKTNMELLFAVKLAHPESSSFRKYATARKNAVRAEVPLPPRERYEPKKAKKISSLTPFHRTPIVERSRRSPSSSTSRQWKSCKSSARLHSTTVRRLSR